MSRKPSRSTPEQFKLFHLQPQHAGQTLAKVLKSLLPESSWGQAQQWVQQRQVQVNGNLCLDPARRVTEKDVIKLWQQPLPKPVTAEQLRLPYLDEHLVVVDKPAGITSVWHREERSMPTKRRQLQPTLEEMLPLAIARALGQNPNREPRRSGPLPRGARPRRLRDQDQPAKRWPVFPVHRLDRDTSGLMLFARTRLAEQKLIRLFRDHRIERQYWAVALGQVASQTLRSLLVRDRGDGLRGSLPENHENPTADTMAPATTDSQSMDGDEKTGQLAITHVQLVESLGNYSIVRCRLETGRTHQIRIHLSESGHPLCGEKTYLRLRDGQVIADDSEAPRQALHAERLSFIHPISGQRLDFHTPLPTDLKQWLTRLRRSIQPPSGGKPSGESG